MSGDFANLDAIAKLMLSFIDQIRIAAAHDMACEPHQNPLQRAYEVCISKLSDEERGELLRIIDKRSQQLEEQELASVLNQKFAAFYQVFGGCVVAAKALDGCEDVIC